MFRENLRQNYLLLNTFPRIFRSSITTLDFAERDILNTLIFKVSLDTALACWGKKS